MSKVLFAAASAALLLAGCVTPPPPPPPPPTVTSVEVTPKTASINVGDTQAFSAVAKTAAGAVVSNVTVSWKSSNTAAVTIGADGRATGKTSGASDITASVGNVTSDAVRLTVSGSGVGVVGRSAQSADGSAWYGGGDVTLQAGGSVGGKTVSRVNLTISGADGLVREGGTPLNGTYSGPALVIPADLNPTMKRGVRVEITGLTFSDGTSGTPPSGLGVLTLNIDNEGPGSLAWIEEGDWRYEGECHTFSPYPRDVPDYPKPGTLIEWRYRTTDSGVGVGSAEHHVYLDVEGPNNEKPGGADWTQEALKPTQVFAGSPASAEGSTQFRALGGGKNHRVYVFDALGNPRAKYVNGKLTGVLENVACNDYLENGDLGHTMPRIPVADVSGSAATGFTLVARNVFASPPDGEGCRGCVSQPDYTAKMIEVRFYRRAVTGTVFEYLGSTTVNPQTNAPGDIPAPAEVNAKLDEGPAGQYEAAVSVVNNYYLQNFSRNGYTK